MQGGLILDASAEARRRLVDESMLSTLEAPIPIVVVEGYALLRDGLLSWLSQAEGIAVLGSAGDGESGLNLARVCHPRVLLLDEWLPDIPGFELAARAHLQSPDTAIVLLVRKTPSVPLQALRRIGVRAFASVGASRSRILTIIRAVAAGSNLLAGTDSVIDDEQFLPVELTKRERQILYLIAAGRQSAEIAKDLCISIRTVESHLSHLYTKLDAHSRTEAVYIARELRIFSTAI